MAQREEPEEERAMKEVEEAVEEAMEEAVKEADAVPHGAKRQPAIAPPKVPSASALHIQRWGERTQQQEGLLPPGELRLRTRPQPLVRQQHPWPPE